MDRENDSPVLGSTLLVAACLMLAAVGVSLPILAALFILG